MKLLDRLRAFSHKYDISYEGSLNPLGAVIEDLYSATEGTINGRRTILVGTNNYLGLSFDNDCINASHHATRNYGTGTTGSR